MRIWRRSIRAPFGDTATFITSSGTEERLDGYPHPHLRRPGHAYETIFWDMDTFAPACVLDLVMHHSTGLYERKRLLFSPVHVKTDLAALVIDFPECVTSSSERPPGELDLPGV